MDFEKIISLAAAEQISLKKADGLSVPTTFVTQSNDLLRLCELLHRHPDMYFDQLSCVTGVDNGPAAGTMEVIYHLYSIPFNFSMALKVILARENPEVNSLCKVWRSADWMEREIFDMYGIRFTDHPDLRRILMPADWEGHPLRKDYQQQETYRDIKVSS